MNTQVLQYHGSPKLERLRLSVVDEEKLLQDKIRLLSKESKPKTRIALKDSSDSDRTASNKSLENELLSDYNDLTTEVKLLHDMRHSLTENIKKKKKKKKKKASSSNRNGGTGNSKGPQKKKIKKNRSPAEMEAKKKSSGSSSKEKEASKLSSLHEGGAQDVSDKEIENKVSGEIIGVDVMKDEQLRPLDGEESTLPALPSAVEATREVQESNSKETTTIEDKTELKKEKDRSSAKTEAKTKSSGSSSDAMEASVLSTLRRTGAQDVSDQENESKVSGQIIGVGVIKDEQVRRRDEEEGSLSALPSAVEGTKEVQESNSKGTVTVEDKASFDSEIIRREQIEISKLVQKSDDLLKRMEKHESSALKRRLEIEDLIIERESIMFRIESTKAKNEEMQRNVHLTEDRLYDVMKNRSSVLKAKLLVDELHSKNELLRKKSETKSFQIQVLITEKFKDMTRDKKKDVKGSALSNLIIEAMKGVSKRNLITDDDSEFLSTNSSLLKTRRENPLLELTQDYDYESDDDESDDDDSDKNNSDGDNSDSDSSDGDMDDDDSDDGSPVPILPKSCWEILELNHRETVIQEKRLEINRTKELIKRLSEESGIQALEEQVSSTQEEIQRLKQFFFEDNLFFEKKIAILEQLESKQNAELDELDYGRHLLKRQHSIKVDLESSIGSGKVLRNTSAEFWISWAKENASDYTSLDDIPS
jgi:hypothetical protein